MAANMNFSYSPAAAALNGARFVAHRGAHPKFMVDAGNTFVSFNAWLDKEIGYGLGPGIDFRKFLWKFDGLGDRPFPETSLEIWGLGGKFGGWECGGVKFTESRQGEMT